MHSLLSIKELIKDKKVRFQFYRSGELWYETEPDHGALAGFAFPVPIDDTGGAVFLAEDKAILYMRWIRKHHASIAKEIEAWSQGKYEEANNDIHRVIDTSSQELQHDKSVHFLSPGISINDS